MKPHHVAIIMDGNGRWAKERKRPRVWGHIRGAHLVSKIIEKADDLGVSYLTLYALSSENLSRPEKELKVLFRLLEKFLKKERERILQNEICFKVIGDYSFVSNKLQEMIFEMEEKTKKAKGLKLRFAFGHGGRQSIINCVKSLKDRESVVEKDIEDFFQDESPDVDLMIRTGGDKRISNFLLWQMAYADLVFSPTKWPDFTEREFEKILSESRFVKRRFGGLGEYGSLEETQRAARGKRCQTQG